MERRKYLVALFCVMFVVVSLMPAVSTSVAKITTSTTTTASSVEGEVLKIYGNANEDDTVDMRDVTYIKLVIFGKKPKTALCDANHDGKVSGLDVVQTKLIIVGKEARLTFVDSEGEVKTIDMPVNSVIPLNSDAAEAIRVVGAAHKIVAIDSSISKKTSFFPKISTLPTIGRGFNPDIEEILAISPDIVIAYAPGIYNPGHEDLEEISWSLRLRL
ncbi:MAG: hypothetical protein ACXQTS_00020 [Candidatus Methanospirareceae archaeon]